MVKKKGKSISDKLRDKRLAKVFCVNGRFRVKESRPRLLGCAAYSPSYDFAAFAESCMHCKHHRNLTIDGEVPSWVIDELKASERRVDSLIGAIGGPSDVL